MLTARYTNSPLHPSDLSFPLEQKEEIPSDSNGPASPGPASPDPSNQSQNSGDSETQVSPEVIKTIVSDKDGLLQSITTSHENHIAKIIAKDVR